MRARAIHYCYHVLDLDASLTFYREAFGLEPVRRVDHEDGSCIVFVQNADAGFQLELMWDPARTSPYATAGDDAHLCFAVDDLAAARARHEAMGCVTGEHPTLPIYYVADPDGNCIEVAADNVNNLRQPGADVLAALSRRRSIRLYMDDPVPADKLEAVVRAGLLSASGRALRPWELIVVTERETLEALSKMRPMGSGMLAGAGAAIVVVAREDVDTWIEDASIVMANMHLAADALGLGSCWIQGRMRPSPDGGTADDYVRALLGVPEGYRLEATLSLGVPAERREPNQVTEKLLAKVHLERF